MQTLRISKETKVLPPEQEGGKENFCFFHCREWDQLIPWLTPRWPFWGPFWVNHGWKKQKFSFPPSCSGGRTFVYFEIRQVCTFSPQMALPISNIDLPCHNQKFCGDWFFNQDVYTADPLSIPSPCLSTWNYLPILSLKMMCFKNMSQLFLN